MKKLFEAIWDILLFMSEFLCQVAYVGYAIAGLLILYNFVPTPHAVIYTICILIHFISIKYFADKADTDNHYCLGKKQNKAARNFIISNIILFVVTGIITNIIYSLLLLVYLAFLISIYIPLTEYIVCSGIPGIIPKIISKCPQLFLVLLTLLPIVAIIIPLILLPWFWFIKVLVVLAYIVSMPFIAEATDNMFDIREIFGA